MDGAMDARPRHRLPRRSIHRLVSGCPNYPMTYYNEIDPKAAAWLRELIAAGLVPAGDVDTRSIVEIRPHEISQYTQQHFFAGVGGWPLALRLAGWSDSRPVRTGSCPCQPFSQAGQGKGEADERHLWPIFRDLITFGEPTVTFGEQVASKAGRGWLSGVRADLEGLGYAVGAADLCAACVGAPHMRQRLFWMAHAQSLGLSRRVAGNGSSDKSGRRTAKADRSSDARRMADTDGGNASAEGIQCSREHGQQPQDGGAGTLAHASREGLPQQSGRREQSARPASPIRPWDTFDLLPCSDGKARRVEPGSFPLAHGIPARMVRLRGYGNAIVPQVAAEFVMACDEILTANSQAQSSVGLTDATIET